MMKSTLGPALCAIVIAAGPVSAADGGSAPGSPESARAAAAAADMAAPNRTIQLLLQMQSAAPLADGEKPLPEPPGKRSARTAPATPPTTSQPSNRPASPANPEPSHWTAAVEPVQNTAAMADPGPAEVVSSEPRVRTSERQDRPGAEQDLPDVRRFLPTEWLRMLRENREIAIVVSLVVLALFGAGAATSGSKKRRR